MRSIFTLLILLFSFLSTFSQEVSKYIESVTGEDVPFEVLENQQQLFPFNFVSEWQFQKKDRSTDSPILRFISTINKDGDSNLLASYLSNGQLLFTSEFILPETVPENIRLDIKKKNPKFKIQAADFITFAIPKKEIYFVKLLDNTMLQYVFYDSLGNEIDKKDLPMEMMMLLR